jgi:hypothetical protein
MEEMNLGSNCCRKLRAQERDRESETEKGKRICFLKFEVFVFAHWLVCFFGIGGLIPVLDFFFPRWTWSILFWVLYKSICCEFFLIASNMQQLLIVVGRRSFFSRERERERVKKNGREKTSQNWWISYLMSWSGELQNLWRERERERDTHTHTPRDRERIKIA